MSRRILPLTALLIGLIAPASRAQVPLTSELVPSRTALSRLNLERNWFGVVPLGLAHERVLMISQADGMLFAQTNQANLHAFDAETGRYLWGQNLGRGTSVALGVSANSDMVVVTNSQDLHCLDKRTGRPVWRVTLDNLPSTATACDEERAMVGLRDGKLVAYSIRDRSRDETPGLSAATFLWAWKTNARLSGRPLPALRVVAFGSLDHRVYVALLEGESLLYRYLTGGPISGSLASYGTRTLLAPSEDTNLYAIDLFNGETRWIFSAGGPIESEPVVANDEIFVETAGGRLILVDPETGTARWQRPTGLARMVSVSPTRIYLRSRDGDLLIVDRASGRLVADEAGTRDRAGLSLREFTLSTVNRFTDRLYFCTPSGFLISLREAGQFQPTPLRDPNAEPFGFLPEEDEEATPPQNPMPGDDQPAAPAAGFGGFDDAAP